MPTETTPIAEIALEASVNAPDLTPPIHAPGPPAPEAATADRLDAPPPADPKPTADPAKPAAGPSVTQIETLLEQLKNLPVSQVDALLDAIDRETGTQRVKNEVVDEEEVQIDNSSVSRKGPVRYAELDQGTQRAIAATHNYMMEQAVTQVLDSDKELSYNMSVIGPKARGSVVAILKGQMEKEIAKEGDGFDYDWARVAQTAMAKAGPIVAPFFDRPTPRAGMGPGGVASLGRELQEPRRVPAYADEEDYATYIQNKLQYEIQKAERESGTQGV